MLAVTFSKKFRRDMKHIQKQPQLMAATYEVIEALRHRKKLAPRYKDHKLAGDYAGCRECHVKPDLLLVYYIENETLHLARLGSHAELFNQ